MRWEDLGLLALRMGAGLMLALLHGWGKASGAYQHFLHGGEWSFVGSVSQLGFPFPIFFAICAAVAEFVGGLCLAAGLGTRYASALIGFTMLVAVYRHLITNLRIEAAALYLLVALLFLTTDRKLPSLEMYLRR